MNKVEIHSKTVIIGEVLVPSSKSYAQRAIAIAGLSQVSTKIDHLVYSEDVKAALNILKDLGASFDISDNELTMQSGINLSSTQRRSINCKESGLSTRLFSAFSLLYNQTFRIDGEGSIKKRTMEMIIEGLTQFGKEVESNHQKLPLEINGKIENQNVEIDGSISSQFLTGLLIVTPFLPFNTTIKVRDLKSKPYIKMTMDLLQHFGLKVEQKDFKTFKVEGNQSINEHVNYSVEGDWSAASFHAVAGAIGGRVKIKGLAQNSQQGDKAILEALSLAGAIVEWEKEDLLVKKDQLKAFEFDANECPDLFPPLAVLAAYADGKSIIKGVKRLIHKESNRGLTLQEEFEKIGIKIELQADEMHIHGNNQSKITKEFTFSSHNDHRIAMAMSLFSIGATTSIFIDEANAVDKSYPAFYEDFLTI